MHNNILIQSMLALGDKAQWSRKKAVRARLKQRHALEKPLNVQQSATKRAHGASEKKALRQAAPTKQICRRHEICEVIIPPALPHSGVLVFLCQRWRIERRSIQSSNIIHPISIKCYESICQGTREVPYRSVSWAVPDRLMKRQ